MKFGDLPVKELAFRSRRADREHVAQLVQAGRAESLEDFAALISPAAGEWLETMAGHSQRLTQHFYGKAIRLFAPLYLSNECVNICTYCGFSRHNDIPRITIPLESVVSQTEKLAGQGFRNLLLVAGEHPKAVNNGYVEACIREILPIIPALSIELGPMETKEYAPLVDAGGEGLIVYQETYHRETYEQLHTAGPKKYYAWRLDTPERGYAAGFRRLGIG
ncbi:MAG: 2-iminoacetate synthase ThiH, partial [Verrucomicrobiota bacterium]